MELRLQSKYEDNIFLEFITMFIDWVYYIESFISNLINIFVLGYYHIISYFQ